MIQGSPSAADPSAGGGIMEGVRNHIMEVLRVATQHIVAGHGMQAIVATDLHTTAVKHSCKFAGGIPCETYRSPRIHRLTGGDACWWGGSPGKLQRHGTGCSSHARLVTRDRKEGT